MLAIEAVGKVTHEDYRTILIPKAEAMMAKGPIKMLYVIGKEFTGYELEALWDDGAFGIKHWREFKRIAVVTGIRHGCAPRSHVHAVYSGGSAALQIYPKFVAAKDWVINAQTGAA